MVCIHFSINVIILFKGIWFAYNFLSCIIVLFKGAWLVCLSSSCVSCTQCCQVSLDCPFLIAPSCCQVSLDCPFLIAPLVFSNVYVYTFFYITIILFKGVWLVHICLWCTNFDHQFMYIVCLHILTM
jgi:hypothetical protein